MQAVLLVNHALLDHTVPLEASVHNFVQQELSRTRLAMRLVTHVLRVGIARLVLRYRRSVLQEAIVPRARDTTTSTCVQMERTAIWRVYPMRYLVAHVRLATTADLLV